MDRLADLAGVLLQIVGVLLFLGWAMLCGIYAVTGRDLLFEKFVEDPANRARSRETILRKP